MADRQLDGPALSPDGKLVAVAAGRTVQVFAVRSGEQVDEWEVPLPPRAAGSLWFLNSRSVVAVHPYLKPAVQLRDVAARKTVTDLSDDAAWAAVSPADGTLAFGAFGEASVRDPAGGPPRQLLTRAAGVSRGAYSPDGKVLALSKWGGAVLLWDVAAGKPLPSSADPPSSVTELRFLAGGRRLAGMAGGWITWELPAGGPGTRLTTHEWIANVRRTDVSPDGRVVVTHAGNTLVATDARTRAVVWKVPDAKVDSLWKLRFSADGRRVVARFGKRVEVREAADGELVGSVAVRDGIAMLTVSPDARWAVVEGLGNNFQFGTRHGWHARAIDLESGREVWSDPDHGISPDDEGAFSADGSVVAYPTTRLDKSGRQFTDLVLVRNAATGRELAQVRIEAMSRGHTALSPDGRFVAAGGAAGVITVHSTDGGKEVRRFEQGSAVTALAFSPDGMVLAAASPEAPVYLWDFYGVRTGSSPDAAAVRAAVAGLADADPAVAFRATRTLLAAPAEAVGAIRAAVPTPAATDPAAVRRLIADLDSPDFRARDRAEKELAGAMPLVADAVRAALEAGPTAEQRDRLLRVQRAAADRRPTAEDLRGTRAVGVLERIGGPEAKAELRRLAGGAPRSATARAAAAALKRLGE